MVQAAYEAQSNRRGATIRRRRRRPPTACYCCISSGALVAAEEGGRWSLIPRNVANFKAQTRCGCGERGEARNRAERYTNRARRERVTRSRSDPLGALERPHRLLCACAKINTSFSRTVARRPMAPAAKECPSAPRLHNPAHPAAQPQAPPTLRACFARVSTYPDMWRLRGGSPGCAQCLKAYSLCIVCTRVKRCGLAFL